MIRPYPLACPWFYLKAVTPKSEMKVIPGPGLVETSFVGLRSRWSGKWRMSFVAVRKFSWWPCRRFRPGGLAQMLRALLQQLHGGCHQFAAM